MPYISCFSLSKLLNLYKTVSSSFRKIGSITSALHIKQSVIANETTYKNARSDTKSKITLNLLATE